MGLQRSGRAAGCKSLYSLDLAYMMQGFSIVPDIVQSATVEMLISLNWHSQRATSGKQLIQAKIAEFRFKSHHKTIKEEIFLVLFAFQDIPRPVRIRSEELAINFLVSGFPVFLGI